jgi:NADH:ubiquinone oxidoreductase subunit 2 (subunit N)
MFRTAPPSPLFKIVALLLAGAMVVLSLLPVFDGRSPNYIGLILNLPVVVALVTNARFAKSIVKVWAMLPIISLGLYVLVAMLRGSFGQEPGPVFWLSTAAIGAGMFLWANSAFPRRLF